MILGMCYFISEFTLVVIWPSACCLLFIRSLCSTRPQRNKKRDARRGKRCRRMGHGHLDLDLPFHLLGRHSLAARLSSPPVRKRRHWCVVVCCAPLHGFRGPLRDRTRYPTFRSVCHRTECSSRYHAAQPGNHTGSSSESLARRSPAYLETLHYPVWWRMHRKRALLKRSRGVGTSALQSEEYPLFWSYVFRTSAFLAWSPVSPSVQLATKDLKTTCAST